MEIQAHYMHEREVLSSCLMWTWFLSDTYSLFLEEQKSSHDIAESALIGILLLSSPDEDDDVLWFLVSAEREKRKKFIGDSKHAGLLVFLSPRSREQRSGIFCLLSFLDSTVMGTTVSLNNAFSIPLTFVLGGRKLRDWFPFGTRNKRK